MFFNHQKALLVRFVLIFTLLGGMLGMSSVRSAQADTLIVTNTNDSGPGSLREAILTAVSGDTITFDPALAGSTITLSSELFIEKNLTIDGSELNPRLVLSGGNVSRIMQITVNAQVIISDLAFTLGNAVEGGAIYVNGNAQLDVANSRFYQNQASFSGGAISVQGNGSLTVNNSTFSNNTAGSAGGAISVGSSGSNTISQSTIKENHAGSTGGAVSITEIGATWINDSTIARNHVGADGGAISITELGVGYIVNSTITGNEADSRGGAIYFGHGPANVFNSTFAHNTATSGSEVFIADSLQFTFYNTVVACLPGVSSCYADIGVGELILFNSILETGTLAELGLAELADNGGLIQTMALLPNSPLIDTGDDTVCTIPPVSNLDQRGVPRPQGSHCDIGAYEDQSLVRFVKQDAMGTGDGSSWSNAHTDLQSALAAAIPDEEIWVAAGTYKPTSGTDRTISFTLKNGVAVYGGFAGTETTRDQRNYETNVTILSGDIGVQDDKSDNSYHVVVGSNTNNSAILDGFTVAGGQADDTTPNYYGIRGGGMYNYDGNPTVMNVVFIKNYAVFGGGMYNDGMHEWENSSPVLKNVSFINNSAIEAGGMRNDNYSSPTLTDIIFDSNVAERSGGGLENFYYNSPVLTNVTFTNNMVINTMNLGGGGGMANFSSTPSLTNVTFSNNSAPEGGGMLNASSNSILSNVTFTGNSGEIGGGIANDQSSPILSNVIFSKNTATSIGGGMHNENSSSPVLTDVSFVENSAPNGGGMHNLDSSPSLTNVILQKNGTASYGSVGGGITNNHSEPTLVDVTFRENLAGEGGGMYNYYSNPTLTNVSFEKNSATWYGGGMINDVSSPNLLNVTFSNNSAEFGGAMLNFDLDSNPTLNHVTMSNNVATSGGGAIANSGNPIIRNSILWGNVGGWGNTSGEILNFSGTPVVTYSIVQGGYPGTGNLDADPLLGPLQDNGGFTQTMALGDGSPAIDAGDAGNCPATDQRGVSRPQGNGCDIGAYEVEIPNSAPTDINLLPSSVNENQPAGTTIGLLSTTDLDAGDSHTYTFCGGTDDASFSISGNQLKTAAVFDYETKTSYSVCIRSTDSGSLSTTKIFLIGVNDLADTETFGDVSSGYWAWNFIERLYDAGITGGCNLNPLEYCPESTVTRAQMAVFLLKGIHGSGYNPPSVGGSTGFGDVPTNYWAAAWIKQLAAEGITGGCGNGNYCPESPVTRAQMAVFLLRSKHGASYNPPAVGSSTGFSDVPTSYWAASWIKQLVAEGITAGCGANTYCPESPVTRAQMAVFLVRTFNLP